VVGWGLFNLLQGDEEEGCDEPSNTVQKSPTKSEVLEAETTRTLQDDSQATAQLETALQPGDEPETHAVSDECASEAEQRLMIRQAMSELGKRSAAARAKRKAANLESVQAAI